MLLQTSSSTGVVIDMYMMTWYNNQIHNGEKQIALVSIMYYKHCLIVSYITGISLAQLDLELKLTGISVHGVVDIFTECSWS